MAKEVAVQERSACSKTDTFQLEWNLQLLTWMSQIPSREIILFFFMILFYFATMSWRLFAELRVRLSNSKNMMPTVKNSGGSIMLRIRMAARLSGGLHKVNAVENKYLYLQIHELFPNQQLNVWKWKFVLYIQSCKMCKKMGLPHNIFLNISNN